MGSEEEIRIRLPSEEASSTQSPDQRLQFASNTNTNKTPESEMTSTSPMRVESKNSQTRAPFKMQLHEVVNKMQDKP